MKARGIRGELLAEGFGQQPERFARLANVMLFRGEAPEGEFVVESVLPYRGRWIVKLRGVDDMTRAGQLRGCEMCVPSAERSEPAGGEFYLPDLIGCRVVDAASGEELGTVEAWQEYGGTPVLVAGTLEIPFARTICVNVDLAARKILVDLPAGLKELNSR
ncbi:MAG: 16S rRNA processing protein RimM [Bryobacterales bacterium]|nr:16S rRNA processing protein RimM [Bryobacterales bacterium]